MLTSGNFLLMILLIGNGAHRSNGYSRGAPEEACLKMIPEVSYYQIPYTKTNDKNLVVVF